MLYQKYQNRPVLLKEPTVGSFIKACECHTADCVDSVHFVLKELSSQDPDVDELIARLADDFDVFLVKIPERKHCKMVLSITYAPEPLVYVHALVFGSTPDSVVERIARNSLGKLTEVWETI